MVLVQTATGFFLNSSGRIHSVFDCSVNSLKIVTILNFDNFPSKSCEGFKGWIHRKTVEINSTRKFGIIIRDHHHERIKFSLTRKSRNGGKDSLASPSMLAPSEIVTTVSLSFPIRHPPWPSLGPVEDLNRVVRWRRILLQG